MPAAVVDLDVELSELSLQDVEAEARGGDIHAPRASTDGSRRTLGSGADGFQSVRSDSQDDFPPLEGETGEDQQSKVIPGNSSKVGAAFNFVNSIVGAGIIGLAYAVRESGFGIGLFMLVFVAILTYQSVNMIVGCGIKAQARSYEGLCRVCFGQSGFYCVSLFMFIFAFGAMCAYLVIVGDTIPVVLEHLGGFDFSREAVIATFAVFIILPLCLLRDMAALSWSSTLSISADAVIVVIVLWRSVSVSAELADQVDRRISFAEPSLFAGLGVISFAYVCQHSSFIVFNTLREPTMSSWRLVNVGSICAAFLLSILLALSGYLTFFDTTKANVLNNFACNDQAINFARLLLAVTMVFTFPMENFVARHSLFALCKGFSPELKGPRAMSDGWHFGLSLGLWGAALLVGLVVRDLGVVIELTGALGGSMLGYILPAVCYFKVHSFRGLYNRSRAVWKPAHPAFEPYLITRLHAMNDFWLPLFMLAFGFIAMIAGTVTALADSRRGAGVHECLGFNDTVTVP